MPTLNTLSAFFGLAFVLNISGCFHQGANGTEGHPIALTPVYSGQAGASDQETKRLEVATNQTQYESLLYLVKSTEEADPIIDFNESTLLVAFMGVQNSGGYTVEIVKAEELDTHIRVTVVSTEPGNGCAVDTALSYPYDFKTIDKTGKPILFREEIAFDEC